MGSFAHRKQAEKLRNDIAAYLARGGTITEVAPGQSGEKTTYGRLNCSTANAAKARLNGQKACGRQKQGSR
ncbi:hypothetical protein [Alloalcanivorax xenomutans]|uniref:hypothetical protein n=1 Tax=Alloalcanivorax xenomutans TaxID=1094342 RepID=UPI003AB423B9